LSAPDLINSCEAAVFDCADTLVHLDPPREVIFNDAAAEVGLNLRLGDIACAYKLAEFAVRMRSSELRTLAKKSEFYRTFNTALCAALGISQTLEKLHPILMQRFSERRRWLAFEDAAETLRAIGQRVPVHVLANWDAGLDEVLRRAGLRHLLQDVVASAILGFEKPDRACFDAFVVYKKLNPARTVYIGNEYITDVIGAREAGMMPVLVDRTDRFSAADCARVRTLGDLITPHRRNSLCPSH
jgi:putative hydrolase of the HAD superfamily